MRPAGPEDVAALLALVESAFRGESAKRGWTHEADLLGGQRTDAEALSAMIADPSQTMLLLEDAGALLGCVSVTDKGDARAYLGMLTVRPDMQGAGLGRRLVDGAEAFAREQLSARNMEMTVIKQRPELIDWYLRHGYRLTGRQAPFPLDDPRFGLPKRGDLVFVILAKAL